MAVKIIDNISTVQAVPAVTSETFRDVSKPLSFYIVGAGTAPIWKAVITLYEIDKIGYKKTGKSVSFAVSNSNPAELYTWTTSATSFVAHVSSISNASVTVYMTQAVDSALERILLTEPSSGTKAMPSDIVGCAAEYVTGQGWIGNLGVLDSKAVLDSFPTNALVPGKVWAVVASASSFAKYNYMSAGWALESSVGPTGSSNIQGSPSNPFASTTERDAWAAANPGELLSGGRTKKWTIIGGVPAEYVWAGPGAGDWVISTIIEVTGGFDTRANLNANLNYAAGSCVYVTNDPTPANNGMYRKLGASGTGSWVQSSYDRVALVESSAISLDRRKADFAAGKNKFDPNDPEILVGKYLQDNTGNVGTSANYTITGYIHVKELTNYTISSLYSMVWYGKDRNVIQVVNSSGIQKLQASPALAVFARVTIYNPNVAAFQFEESSTGVSSEYEPFISVESSIAQTDANKATLANMDIKLSLADADELKLVGGTLVAGSLGANPAIMFPTVQQFPCVIEFDFKFPADPNVATTAYELISLRSQGATNPFFNLSLEPHAPTVSAYVPTYAMNANVIGRTAQTFVTPTGRDAFSVRKVTPTASDTAIILEVTSDRVKIYDGGTSIGEWLFSGYATLASLTAAMRATLGAGYSVVDYNVGGMVPADIGVFIAYLCKAIPEINEVTGVATGSTIYDSYETFVPALPTKEWRKIRIELTSDGIAPAWKRLRNIQVYLDGATIFKSNSAVTLSAEQVTTWVHLNYSTIGGVSAMAPIRNFSMSHKLIPQPRFLAVMTHALVDGPEQDGVDLGLTMTSGRLARIVAAAKRYGWSFGTIGDLINMNIGNIPRLDKMIVFTTDDSLFGWDTQPVIKQIFQQNNIKCTTAIIANSYDFAANSATLLRKFLGGNAYACHGYNHVHMEQLSYTQFVTAMNAVKTKFVANGYEVNAMIWPYGGVNLHGGRWAKNNGWVVGFGVNGGVSPYGYEQPSYNLGGYQFMKLPRQSMDDAIPFSTLDAILNV